MLEEKTNKEKKEEGCPDCKVSDETLEILKKEGQKKKERKEADKQNKEETK